MKHHTSEPSQRQLRVGEQLRHIIAETLQRGHFGSEILIDHASEVSVTEVRSSPDLKHAKAYVISLGGKNLDAILSALNDDAATFQKDINRHSNLKFTPRVKFVVDESFGEAQKIEDILRDIHYAPSEDEQEDSANGT
jgi:ribosome-binding factor A